MTKINSILDQRMKKPSNTSKMAAMAMQSASGNLTSFSGVFGIMELSAGEKESLNAILKNYSDENIETEADLERLISLTSEVKAINNQAALLHGERIKKVQEILMKYRDGAFTAWLMTAYGNRQTPYNFLQYYEFCEAMPKQLRPQIELIPRQAIYVLASRDGEFDLKRGIVENYRGETKNQMLTLIRQTFPLHQNDRRQKGMHIILVNELQKVFNLLKRSKERLTASQKKQMINLLNQIQELVVS